MGGAKYRAKGERKVKPILFLFGDGESESTYFNDLGNMLKGRRIRVCSTEVTGPERILKKCRGRELTGEIRRDRGDEVCIITDFDGRYSENELMKFQKECDSENYQLFMSNISFEIWLLMHFKQLNHPYTQEELEKELSDCLGRKYDKVKGIPFDPEDLEMAIRHASERLKNYDNLECLRKNPSTTVHFLIDRIRNFE